MSVTVRGVIKEEEGAVLFFTPRIKGIAVSWVYSSDVWEFFFLSLAHTIILHDLKTRFGKGTF